VEAGNLIGLDEIAELLGVSRARIVRIRSKDPSFPAPVVTLSQTPIWDIRNIIVWANDTGREIGYIARKRLMRRLNALDSPKEPYARFWWASLGVLVVEINLTELDDYTTDLFRPAVMEALGDNPSNVILDLSKVIYMSSAALGALVAIRKYLKKHSKRLCLVNVTPTVTKVFAVTGLTGLFPAFTNLKRAISYATSKFDIPARPQHNTHDGWHWFPARVYLSNARAGITVQRSLTDLSSAFGMEIVWEYPVRRGSWSREFLLRMKDSTARPTRDEQLELLTAALLLHPLGKSPDQAEAVQGQAVASLITALDKTAKAVVQIGSVLIVKVRDVVIVRNLTPLELEHWERSPEFFENPDAALRALQQMPEIATSSLSSDRIEAS
jgi:anti-anti-sigma factor